MYQLIVVITESTGITGIMIQKAPTTIPLYSYETLGEVSLHLFKEGHRAVFFLWIVGIGVMHY